MVSAGCCGDGLDCPRTNPLPERLGPICRSDHGEQREEEGKCAEGEEDPLVAPATMSPLGSDQEPDRGPRDDLIPLPEQQVDEEWQRSGTEGDSDSGSGSEDGEQGEPDREWGTRVGHGAVGAGGREIGDQPSPAATASVFSMTAAGVVGQWLSWFHLIESLQSAAARLLARLL